MERMKPPSESKVIPPPDVVAKAERGRVKLQSILDEHTHLGHSPEELEAIIKEHWDNDHD